MANGMEKVKKEVAAATKKMESSNKKKLDNLISKYRQSKSPKKS